MPSDAEFATMENYMYVEVMKPLVIITEAISAENICNYVPMLSYVEMCHVSGYHGGHQVLHLILAWPHLQFCI